MKVILCIPLPPPDGGMTRWSTLVTNFLRESNLVKFDIIDISPKDKTSIKRGIFQRIFIQGIFVFSYCRKLKFKVKNEGYDIVHIATSGKFGVFRDIIFMRLSHKLGVPSVYHLHFGRLNECLSSNSREGRALRKAINLATSIVAMDKTTYHVLKMQFPGKKSTFLPNPIDISSLPQLKEKREKKVVFIGWVVATKGIDELIGAWNVLGKELPEYRLEIIGPSTDDYIGAVRSNIKVGNVDIKGSLSHEKAMECLSSASLFVLPSYTEGFPNVILEAMALKTPIVATTVGAIPEMLTDKGGFLCPPRSEEALVTTLREALSDEKKRREAASFAYDKVVNDYEISKVMASMQDVWDDAIGVVHVK